MNWGKLLTWPIPTGLPLPIVRGPLRGAWWIAGAAAGEGKGLSVVAGACEREQIELARQWTGPETVAFDIGANVGLYTLLFARRGRRVVAFEPVPRNLRFLHRTISLNRLDNVTIVPWALGADLELTAMAAGVNIAEGRMDPAGGQPTLCISCDRFVERYGLTPDLIKIDVEGAEERVIAGAREVLREHRPRIMLSTHGPECRRASLELLRRVGYGQIVPLNASEEASASEFAVTW